MWYSTFSFYNFMVIIQILGQSARFLLFGFPFGMVLLQAFQSLLFLLALG